MQINIRVEITKDDTDLWSAAVFHENGSLLDKTEQYEMYQDPCMDISAICCTEIERQLEIAARGDYPEHLLGRNPSR